MVNITLIRYRVIPTTSIEAVIKCPHLFIADEEQQRQAQEEERRKGK